MKNSILSFILVLAAAQVASAKLEFSKGVTANQQYIIANDLRALGQMDLADPKLAEMIGVPTTDGITLLNYIDNRVNYIIEETFDFDHNLIDSITDFHFPTPPTPVLDRDKPNPNPDPAKKSWTLMSNLGAYYYVTGKSNQKLKAFRINEKLIDIDSAREGILKIGPGMFS